MIPTLWVPSSDPARVITPSAEQPDMGAPSMWRAIAATNAF
jgi:hypothetical protein